MATSLLHGGERRPQASSRVPGAPAVLIAATPSLERTGLEAQLRDWGHPVAVVDRGGDLLEQLERHDAVPVVILDTELPGLGGMALLNQLQLQAARRKSWTILLAPAAGPVLASKSAREAGVDDILLKPIDEIELRISLRAAARVQARYAEMVEALDAARFHSSHDNLTGLLNRDSALHLLFQETDRLQRLGTQLSLLLLDLDQFAQVNREFGYDGGDRILRQLASRFRRYLRSYDIAGRCGPDQFLLAMPGCTQEDARSMATRLRDCVSERPFDILQASVSMTASIGIAQSSGRSPLVVLREAEHALSRAKLAGGACVRWFHADGPEAAGGRPIRQVSELRTSATQSVPA